MKEGGKATSYQYDLLNHQTSVQMPDGRVQENLYDGEGLRAGIRECGKLSTFLYYNGEILAECNGESMPIRRRLPGMSSLQTLEDGQYHACHQDEKGNTIYITGRDGAVENCYVYDAFGNTLEKKEGIQNRIQYTGQQYDQETGQYYLRARYYNPTVGRFTQEDTYRGDGLNLYAYCKNNPVVYYDPSGHNLAAKPSNDPETTNTSGVEKGNLGDSSADVKISGGQSSGKSTDFYVTPSGDVVPATAYRYMNSKYAEQTMESMSAPGSYFGFEKFDSASDAMDAFQISPKWNDCKLRGEFDTLQVIDGMYVPKAYGDKGPGLEPFASCYPEHGKGGCQQFKYKGIIYFKKVDIIDD